jgi:hypothetical protein
MSREAKGSEPRQGRRKLLALSNQRGEFSMRTKFRFLRPTPSMVVAVIAMVLAIGGSAYAGATLSLKALSKGARAQTVGVGPLAYVTNNENIGPTGSSGTTVTATCPPGLLPIGGGIRVYNDATGYVNDSHPIRQGWAGTVFNNGSVSFLVQTTVVCATSRLVSGTPASTTS